MLITVAICTWNRSALLDATLSRMHELRQSSGCSWELLIVNNNCTDDTDRVIDKHSRHLPIRRLLEARPGQCNARNCAIDAARGELILWTDDDVLVDPDWLSAYVAAAKAAPDAAFFGGTIDPWFEVPPSAWIMQNVGLLEGPFAIRQLGLEVRPFSTDETPFGANMAFRVAVLRQYRFNPRLGHAGKAVMGGDETDVIERMRADGHTGVWVGPARVQHFVPVNRMSLSYVLQWCENGGRSMARRYQGAQCARLFGLPRWLIRQYVTSRVKSFLLAPTRGSNWLRAEMRQRQLRSAMRELRN